LRQLIAEGSVLRLGTTRAARYARRREIEGTGSQWPLRRIDQEGAIHDVGILYALVANQYFLATDAGTHFASNGLSAGIPYYLQDQRPGGFLGRAIPRRYPELDLPARVTDWNDDHYLRYLTQRGSDTVGDLVLGDVALDQYLAGLRQRPTVTSEQRETRYPQLAAEVMQGDLPGSSAHGEHPKFTALLQERNGVQPVIVKFSPPLDTAVGQRWGDLLVAEHHAHTHLQAASVPACTSRVHTFANRRFLEVNRFDREGREGRIGVNSLLSIDTAFYGRLDNWIDSATRMRLSERITAGTLEQVRLVATFGTLIANTDQHFGNLAFFDRYDGHFQLAPVYDMLPMLFAPQHDQIVARTFTPPDPTAHTLRVWDRARDLAEGYWAALMANPDISAEFQAIAAACLQALQALPRIRSHAATPG
jgi:hypothetical protein